MAKPYSFEPRRVGTRFTVDKSSYQSSYQYKQLQFIHKLTASDTSKTAKITKKGDITQQHIDIGDVLMGNYIFVIFAVLKQH